MDFEEFIEDEMGDIEVDSELSGEQSPVNRMVELAEDIVACNDISHDVLFAPSFRKHFLHGKKSIHILVRVNAISSTALIDCGATDSFINLAFMKKRGLRRVALECPRTCKLGEGTTQVTHGFKYSLEVGNKCIEVDFYVMNGKSSQGLVLGYSFLSKNDAAINLCIVCIA